jgi:hypothetical protein
LPELHKAAKWAEEQKLPVAFVTINVWEISDPAQNNPDERLKRAKKFWAQRNFSLPIAMDFTDETAASYGVTGIPTTVVIRPDGVIHAYHSGAPPDYAETLKREINEAIAAEDESAEKPIDKS